MHPRDIRKNIWRALLSASDTEIHEGMNFYEGANGLCRLFAKIYGIDVNAVAGIYAALSPLNTWDTNVSNIVDVLRFVAGLSVRLSVNTTNPNRDKALAIARGANPLDTLKGKKVSAFYSAIADPSNTLPIPVDRHLINLALGTKITANVQLRSLLTHYDQVEKVYRELGAREGIGNRLASIAWFVQRRLGLNLGIFIDGTPVCCRVEMWSHGAQRFYCSRCGKSRKRDQTNLLLPGTILTDIGNVRDQLTLSIDSRGRIRIALDKDDEFANSGAWQYLARYEVMKLTGEKLRRDEHVHHTNGRFWDCRTDNLEVWLAVDHGRYHARHQLLYMVRDFKGRFAPSEVPSFAAQFDEMSEVPF